MFERFSSSVSHAEARVLTGGTCKALLRGGVVRFRDSVNFSLSRCSRAPIDCRVGRSAASGARTRVQLTGSPPLWHLPAPALTRVAETGRLIGVRAQAYVAHRVAGVSRHSSSTRWPT